MDCVGDEGHSLLVIQAANETHDGFEFVPQPEAMAQCALVVIFSFEVVLAVVPRQMRIYFRIPNLVIQAVENATDFLTMDVQCMPQPKSLAGVHDFPRVAR